MKLQQYLNEKKVEMTGDEYKDHFLKLLNKWDTDISRLTKAYKAIKGNKDDFFDDSRMMMGFDFKGWKKKPDMKYFFKIKKAYNIFANNFEKWVYNDILDNKKKDENYYQEQVRTTAWTFLSDIRVYQLFESHNSHVYNDSTMYSIPMIWDYSKIAKKNITRYQRSWRKFKEALRELVVYNSEEIKAQTTDEQIQKFGVTIAIKNKTDEHDKYIKKFIDSLKDVTGAIRKHGFAKVLDNFYVELNFDVSSEGSIYATYGDMIGGAYDPMKDKLFIFPLGIDRKISDNTLIHELAHRYWFKYIPERAKKAWKEKFQQKRVRVAPVHIKKFFEMFFTEEYGFPTRKDIKKKVEKEIDDPTFKVVFMYLADNTPMFEPKEGKSRYDAYWDFFQNRSRGEEIPLEWITDYGRTNEKESFAEAFKLWVGGVKGKLGPWTRAFFKEIVATGGVNIKEEKNLIDKYLGESNIKLKPDEIKFLNILYKVIKKASKREMKNFGKESALGLILGGVNMLDVFDEMNIYKDNIRMRIINNLEKAGKIVTVRKKLSGEKVKRYNWGRDRKYIPTQEVSISVRPVYKDESKYKK